MSDQYMKMPTESLNKIAVYLGTKPWAEVNPLIGLFQQAEVVEDKSVASKEKK